MRDSNLHKFVSEDIPLFLQIVQDLFPGINIPEINYGILSEQIKESCNSLNLQYTTDFANKIIQLYDVMNLRFGIMIVGKAS